jgi:hypothetical protein
MVANTQLSAVIDPVIAPEMMVGPDAVAPISTQTPEDGHAIWVREVTVAGNVSAAKVALGVVAPYSTTGAEAVRPVRRHSVVWGQYNPFNEATVVPPGKASAVQAQLGAATPSPAVAAPETTLGPVEVVPVIRQVVETAVLGQAKPEIEVSVTAVGLGELAVQPSPYPPETTIGVPAVGEVLVPVAMQPPDEAGQTRLANPAMVAVVGEAVMASLVHVSVAVEMAPDRTAAPVAVVPMATHSPVAAGHTTCDKEVMPAGVVSVVNAPVDVGADTMTAPAVP